MPRFLFFPYFGPNRRSDKRLVELRIDFDTETDDGFPQQFADIKSSLLEASVLREDDIFPGKPVVDESVASYASLLAQTAILFQRACGHRISFFSVFSEANKGRCTALVEYEHCDVGMTAVKLAVELFNGQLQSLAIPFQQFSVFARKRKLPTETLAIIKAASLRNIPCFQLEQEPFADTLKLAHRVRRNGLLMLGHGASSHIMDGTFCVDQSGDYQTALLRNPDLRFDLLKQLGVSVTKTEDPSPEKTRLFHILVINRKLWALQGQPGQHVDDLHPSLIAAAMAIGEKMGFAPFVIKLETSDISRALKDTGGRILDFELAPDLDVLLNSDENVSGLLDAIATELIDWLFPDPTTARMPMIAVTGTNGKTTNCRMINHILREYGLKPGLVCTDGIFLDGRQISSTDASSLIGHFGVLSSKQVNIAVLETHHRGIVVRGFAFDKCDVAVCLNVTEEHLMEGEIESVEEMTKIKQALMERASHAAVLNADDANCVSMLENLTAERICLVSLQSGIEYLRNLTSNDNACFCVLESEGNEEWLVIYDRNKRSVLMRPDQIPATFDGTASFNTSNAMHAVAATFLLGTNIKAIRSALSTFNASPEMTPGRMNVFDDLPFRVIMDFAHNPDGMKRVAEFADRQKVRGSKLIAFAGSNGRSDRANRLCAEAVAGHFDFYFCKDYERSEIREVGPIARLIRQALVDAGIPEHRTRAVSYGKDVIFNILDTCKPGDLLIILAGHVEIKTIPSYLKEYAQR